jgi:hypothetical protein
MTYGEDNPKSTPTYEQRKFACPNPNCERIMILTYEEYAQGAYVCPYCGDSSDPKIRACRIRREARHARREKLLRLFRESRARSASWLKHFRESCVRSGRWLTHHTPKPVKGALRSIKNISFDVLDEVAMPHCAVKRTRGHAVCSRCLRSITYIVWVEGEPYGTTCYRTAVHAFEAARAEYLQERRRARRGR